MKLSCTDTKVYQRSPDITQITAQIAPTSACMTHHLNHRYNNYDRTYVTTWHSTYPQNLDNVQ